MIDVGSFVPVIGTLPYHELHGYIPEPQESHHLFGAGFLFVGVLLVVEAIAGSVWHRSRLRTLIWPTAVIVMGGGMLIVTAVDPDDRVIHFTIGLLMLAGGLFEARYRLGYIPRATANLLIIPALIGGGLEIGVFHLHGSLSLTSSATVHILLGLTAGGMALVRVYQGWQLTSAPRSALMGVLVMALAFELMTLSHKVRRRQGSLPCESRFDGASQ